MKIKMIWDTDGVRALCVKHEYCTRMNEHEYGRLLNFVRDHECDAERVAYVTQWIAVFSDFAGYTCREAMEAVGYALLNECVRYMPVLV